MPLGIQKFQTIAENVEWVGGWVGIHAMITLGIAFTMVSSCISGFGRGCYVLHFFKMVPWPVIKFAFVVFDFISTKFDTSGKREF